MRALKRKALDPKHLTSMESIQFEAKREEPLTHAKLKRTHHDCLWPMAAGFSKQQHPPSNEIFSTLTQSLRATFEDIFFQKRNKHLNENIGVYPSPIDSAFLKQLLSLAFGISSV